MAGSRKTSGPALGTVLVTSVKFGENEGCFQDYLGANSTWDFYLRLRSTHPGIATHECVAKVPECRLPPSTALAHAQLLRLVLPYTGTASARGALCVSVLLSAF